MARFDYVKTRREDVQKIPVQYEKLVRLGAKLYMKLNVAVYKMSGGRFMNKDPANKPICLVTMTGRKTGQRREIPLMHVPHGDRKILVASLAGISKNPLWYHNLKAQPACRVVHRGREVVCTSREAEGEERERLWTEALATYGGYAEYAARTRRRIPVMVLKPTGGCEIP